jgi:hypothetical protein
MSQKTLHKNDLAHFNGSEHWYRHPLVRKVVYTDGAKYVADSGGAYWLIDEIAFGQSLPAIAPEEFQVWKLSVNLAENTAVLTCDDGNDRVVFTKQIEYTDFPLDEIRLYFTDNTILLPGEY